jgi:hypothetical protein
VSRDPSLDRVILDARIAFKQGDQAFVAGQSVIPGMRASRGRVRRGLGELIAAVEAEGWQVADRESVGTATEIVFTRKQSASTAAVPPSGGGCLLVLVGLLVLVIIAFSQ